MKPTGSPTFSAPYAMPSWKSLAKWLDVAPFTASEWEAIYALPYAARRAAIARRVVPVVAQEERALADRLASLDEGKAEK